MRWADFEGAPLEGPLEEGHVVDVLHSGCGTPGLHVGDEGVAARQQRGLVADHLRASRLYEPIWVAENSQHALARLCSVSSRQCSLPA